jgi:pimeloyl-ACP methyl ester carboxylesterase
MALPEHRLIRYDERGNGLSDWKVDDISFEAFVRDLETVVDAARLDRFSLLGVSQGCPVSIAYAVRKPGRVSHLVLYGGYARGWRRRGDPAEIEKADAVQTLMRHGWARRTQHFVKSLQPASCQVARLSRCVGSTTCNE